MTLMPEKSIAATGIKLSESLSYDLKNCPLPLLVHPRVTKRILSYSFNKQACDVVVTPGKNLWSLSIYATQISYNDLKLEKVLASHHRGAIPLRFYGKSRWMGEWQENGIRYIAGFSCQEKDQDSCLQETEARQILNELVVIKK